MVSTSRVCLAVDDGLGDVHRGAVEALGREAHRDEGGSELVDIESRLGLDVRQVIQDEVVAAGDRVEHFVRHVYSIHEGLSIVNEGECDCGAGRTPRPSSMSVWPRTCW